MRACLAHVEQQCLHAWHMLSTGTTVRACRSSSLLETRFRFGCSIRSEDWQAYPIPKQDTLQALELQHSVPLMQAHPRTMNCMAYDSRLIARVPQSLDAHVQAKLFGSPSSCSFGQGSLGIPVLLLPVWGGLVGSARTQVVQTFTRDVRTSGVQSGLGSVRGPRVVSSKHFSWLTWVKDNGHQIF